MNTYTFEAVKLSGVNGYIVSKRINGVFAGKAFGKTKSAARAKLD